MSDTQHPAVRESVTAEADVVLRWNEHANDLGDWCPWSGERLTRAERAEYEENEDAACCFARCRHSLVEEPETGLILGL